MSKNPKSRFIGHLMMNVTVTVYCTFFIDADAITFSLTEHNGDSKVA